MKTLAAALVVLAAACATSVPSSDAPNYVLLSSPNQVRDYDFYSAVQPQGLRINGTMTNVGFRPVGHVEGNGPFCTAGQDWLSLSDLKVHSASEGKPPVAPYVLGCSKGTVFQPASRTVVVQ